MLLRIDYREKELIDQLDIDHEVTNLDLGDIQILHKDSDIPIFIIERKSLSDLNASIKDGRYREQKARLRSFRQQHGTRLLYIFEGILKGKNKLTPSLLLSCCVNTPLRDGIAVHRTHNITGTIDFITRIMKNSAKWSSGWDSFMTQNGGSDEKTVEQYARTLKSQKKANLTPELCFIRQLATIPGCSAKIGHAIKELYGNMPNLVAAYQSTEQKEDMLADIKINGRRLGKVKSTRIYQFLFQN